MKNTILTICLILFAVQTFAQETKSIKKDSLNYQVKYNVLKSNSNIKQGEYMLISATSGKVLSTGFYKNNLKDSVWRDYNREDHVEVEGKYHEGKKVGEWNYYDTRWNVITKYDFTKNQLLFHKFTKTDSTKLYRVIRATDTIVTVMDKAPFYLGGDLMYRVLASNIRYPALAREKHITGRVLVSFTIDENGHPRDYRIDKGIGYGCDEEALRAVKLIPDEWIPGVLNGKKVPAIMQIPLTFYLQ